MDALVAGGVAGLYTLGVVGVHRLNVWRMRALASGFPALRWLDWDALLDGMLPPPRGAGARAADLRQVVGGGPAPDLLSSLPLPEVQERWSQLSCLVEGRADLSAEVLSGAGFSGGQVHWLTTLSQARSDPERALARLSQEAPSTAAEVYLREHLELELHTHLFNLELAVFASKRRLATAVARFGEQPVLFYLRAYASSLLGFNQSAVDNLARAVYFSRQRPFYLRAVIATPYIESVRPALFQQCRRALQLELDE